MRLMQNTRTLVVVIIALFALGLTAHAAQSTAQAGPRPFSLVDQLAEGQLKHKLAACAADIRRYRHHDFSIGHRGVALQFPEHTKESYEAGRRMGAGILECAVTFTKDGELACRHAQCDLHTTTNILVADLTGTWRVPFTSAEFDANGQQVQAATALCCTTNLTLDEFKSLKGKMDAFNPNATTAEEFLGGAASFRTDLYVTGATLLTHKASIELIDRLGAKFTPELKGIDRDRQGNPFVAENGGFGDSGLDQQTYARKMIQEYLDAGIDPRRVFPQVFNFNDVLQWIEGFPAATEVFTLSSDGLGDKIIGTGFNCSGGVTPWGTVLSAEENFQGSVARFNADGTGQWIPLVLSTPTNPNRPSDLVSMQVTLQPPPYVSGTTGDRNGLNRLPRRSGVAGQAIDGGFFGCTTLNEAAAFTAYPIGYLGTTLASFYTSQGAILCDAFAAGNLVGGAPCARPEDCEVHPYTKAVYLANTDAAAGSDGYVDSRIFTVAKYDAAVNAAQQSGDILRLDEDSADGSGTTFTWSRFSKAGEVGTQPDGTGESAPGMGYANVDNRAFDVLASLWGVTDVSIGAHNAVGDGPSPSAFP